MLHLALHFILPLGMALFFAPSRWWPTYVWMMLAMLVDVDHLLAQPIYDPLRCSVGFHPLHTVWPIVLYGVLCFIPIFRVRYLGIGLMIHMFLDAFDCQITNNTWWQM